jgi:A/G-specific adenine glycosylase
MEKKRILSIQKALLEWYLEDHRDLPWRGTSDPYHIWVSEVMLQQTQVATVLPYYRHFLKRFPNIARLAAADQQEVLKAWEGLGYYARARNLHKATGIVLARHKGRLPQRWDDFRDLPGVGDYIAAAVLSIAFDQPYAVVDGNVKRVLSRLFVIDAPVNRPKSKSIYQQTASELLDTSQPGNFNQAIMELGAMICKPRRPVCPACPLKADCTAYRTDRVAQFPRRIRRQPTPEYRIAVGVIFKKDRVLITRRKPEGLLGGLWEFPGGKIRPRESAETACLREIREEVNLAVGIDAPLIRVRHAYTHFRIRMEVFCCVYLSGRVRLNGPVDHRWIKLDQLQDFPFPKANHKFLSPLMDWYAKKMAN